MDSAPFAGTAFTLAGIDYVIVLVYMIGTFLLGMYFGRYVKDSKDLFLAGKTLPWWAIGMSVVVTDIGATDFISTAGAGYTYGIAAANFDWMGSMPALVIAAFLFVPYYWRAGVFTIPEFLGRRYNAGVQMIHASFWGIYLIIGLSAMLWLTAVMMNTMLGWEIYTSIWVLVVLTGVYTLTGGLSAVVMTDVVQLVVMYVGGLSLLAVSLYAVGGFDDLSEHIKSRQPDIIVRYDAVSEAQAQEIDAAPAIEQALSAAGIPHLVVRDAPTTTARQRGYAFALDVPAEAMPSQEQHAIMARLREALAPTTPEGAEIDVQMRDYARFSSILLPHDSPTPYPWSGIVFGLGIVLATAYMAGNQAVVQRALGARSEWDVKAGLLFAGFLKVFIPLMVIVPGLCAVQLVPTLANGDQAVPTMMRELLPIGLRGLMFAALFAALMSSISSVLNSATTLWTTDLLGRLKQFGTGTSFNDRQSLILGRILTAVFMLTGAYFAPAFRNEVTMYNFFQTVFSMFQGPVLAILLLGILWKRATRWGGLAGLVLGVCFTTVLNATEGVFPSEDPFLFIAWWSFVFSLAVTAIVSLLTPPEPEEKIRGLIFGQMSTDGKLQRVLRDRVEAP